MSEMVVLSDRAQALYQKIKTEQRGVVRERPCRQLLWWLARDVRQ